MENYVQKVSDLEHLDDGKIYASIYREMANVCSTIEDVKHYCGYNYPQYCNYAVADMNQAEAYETYDEMYWAGFLEEDEYIENSTDENIRPSDNAGNPDIYEAVYQHHFEHIMLELGMNCEPDSILAMQLEQKRKNKEKRDKKMELIKTFEELEPKAQMEAWTDYCIENDYDGYLSYADAVEEANAFWKLEEEKGGLDVPYSVFLAEWVQRSPKFRHDDKYITEDSNNNFALVSANSVLELIKTKTTKGQPIYKTEKFLTWFKQWCEDRINGKR